MSERNLVPAEYASWVHVLAHENDLGVRPRFDDKAIPLAVRKESGAIALQFEVRNSGHADAFPAVVSCLVCLQFVGFDTVTYLQVADTEVLVMLPGGATQTITLTLEGLTENQIDGKAPCIFLRIADLTTPAPTLAELREFLHLANSIGAPETLVQNLAAYRACRARMNGLAGFGRLDGPTFPSSLPRRLFNYVDRLRRGIFPAGAAQKTAVRIEAATGAPAVVKNASAR